MTVDTKRETRVRRAVTGRVFPTLGAMQRTADQAWGVRPPRGRLRREDVTAARERLRLLLDLDPRALPPREPLETILAFYASSAAPPRRGGRLPRGRGLAAWLARLQAVLLPLADRSTAQVQLPTLRRGVEVIPASGVLGGFVVRPLADPEDALLLAVLDDLRLVGLQALARCARCRRLCVLSRLGRYIACSPECHQALRTKTYRVVRHGRFLESRRDAYRRRVARRLGKPAGAVRIASHRTRKELTP